jgi:uncharacterized membrane protein YkoI
MRNTLALSLFTLAFVMLAVGAQVNAKEEEVPLDQLPKAVLDAVKAKFPGAKLTEAEKETKDGKTTYEIGLEQKGQEYTVSATAEGKITEVEREVEIKDLPKAVTDAIKKKYPNAKMEEAEEVTADNKTTYEVIVKSGKKELELTLDAGGKILKEEAEDEDDDDDDDK